MGRSGLTRLTLLALWVCMMSHFHTCKIVIDKVLEVHSFDFWLEFISKFCLCNPIKDLFSNNVTIFSDVVSIPKTNENFRLLYDTKGRFRLHSIRDEEAKVGFDFSLFVVCISTYRIIMHNI